MEVAGARRWPSQFRCRGSLHESAVALLHNATQRSASTAFNQIQRHKEFTSALSSLIVHLPHRICRGTEGLTPRPRGRGLVEADAG